MANQKYAKGREGILDGSIDWDTHKIKAVLVDTGAYTVNINTHQFLSDIPVGARIAISPLLTGKTKTDGIADADPTTVPNVVGTTVEAVVLVRAAMADGDADLAEGAQRLIVYLDTGTGLPFTPNGGDVLLNWPDDANKIFRV